MPLALQRRSQGHFPCRAALADSAVALTTTFSNSIALVVHAAPTVTWVAPMECTTFTAPVHVTLNATDGSISQVDFYNGITLIGTVLSGSASDTGSGYTASWSNVAPGTYQLTAKATDNNGARVTTTPVTVTVNATAATIYYIHPDHLGTPRAITTSDTANTKVWEWKNEDAFGNNAPNEDPSATGTAFKYNLRFPGQCFDQETNTNYNYFRDYDSTIGRYIESDPLGLKAGLSTYAYVSNKPLIYIDPEGLAASYTACDGKGNWKAFNNDNACTRACTQAHEDAHVQHYTKKYGVNACANIREGQMPKGAGSKDSLAAGVFYGQSECAAMETSIKCLSNLPCICAEAKTEIESLKRWMGPRLFDCKNRGRP